MESGPIVMNAKEELNKAFDDLRKGTFLKTKFLIEDMIQRGKHCVL